MSRPQTATCARCGDSGAAIDRDKDEWDICPCAAGEALDAEITKGQADIKAGRLHKWEDVRRVR